MSTTCLAYIQTIAAIVQMIAALVFLVSVLLQRRTALIERLLRRCGICSTRLNDRFPLQDSANCLIRVESASCCGANDRSNGSEKIGAPV